MSQYGAMGYASHGWDYKRILAHYYTGTALGVLKEPRDGARAAAVDERHGVVLRRDARGRAQRSRPAKTYVVRGRAGGQVQLLTRARARRSRRSPRRCA